MSFAIPDGLAPETYPLSWLLGTWRGPGFLGYPDIPERPILVELTFTSDGGPYLAYTSTTWNLDGELDSLEGDVDVAALRPGQVWATESGFWRAVPKAPDDASALTDAPAADPAPDAPAAGPAPDAPGAPRTGANASSTAAPPPSATEIEVLLAEPSGHVSVYLGVVQGPRIELATDLVARTASGAEVSAAARMYGLVRGELMWATDMAAFGHEMQSYSSGRLQRQ
ncbi:FABP family protein [Occultella glacieicola]|uniref:Ferric nitrobindin-like protein n=1 Tax=Occultella glacieicola TaxID=2518684 RepID=A0ABY2E1P3_9MICO|nr:FABP family protein [Occultella glacieicola]TDE88335.1 FABP family protein [Occultella glacieicola]